MDMAALEALPSGRSVSTAFRTYARIDGIKPPLVILRFVSVGYRKQRVSPIVAIVHGDRYANANVDPALASFTGNRKVPIDNLLRVEVPSEASPI